MENNGGETPLYCDGIHGPIGNPVVNVIGGVSTTTNVYIDGNDIAGGTGGIYLNWDTTNSKITNNFIHNNQFGIWIIGSVNNNISGNDIYDNQDGLDITGLSITVGDTVIYIHTDASDNIIEANDISNNAGIGIYVGEEAATITGHPVKIAYNNIDSNGFLGILVDMNIVAELSILNNTITNNNSAGTFDGIGIDANDDYNVVANGNTIMGNAGPGGLGMPGNDSGINFIGIGSLDATSNYWGTPTGPYNAISNPNGTGDSVSNGVVFKPYSAGGSVGAFAPGGAFTFTGDPHSATSLTVTADTTLNLGGNSVFLPTGLVITADGGAPFDISLLAASAANPSSFSFTNLAAGITAEGALQWGIPGVHMNFNPAITLSIFVGAALKGQTLTIYRSPTGAGGDWTTDGISGSATCVVTAGGLCTFQATKASYYVPVLVPGAAPAIIFAASSNGSPGLSGVTPTTKTTLTKQQMIDSIITQLRALLLQLQAMGGKIPAGMEKYLALRVTNFTKDSTVGSKGDDVKALQQFLNSKGFKVADSGAGSLGNESTYFGKLTQAALAKFQKSVGITPAAGYFGPKTRAKIQELLK